MLSPYWDKYLLCGFAFRGRHASVKAICGLSEYLTQHRGIVSHHCGSMGSICLRMFLTVLKQLAKLQCQLSGSSLEDWDIIFQKVVYAFNHYPI